MRRTLTSMGVTILDGPMGTELQRLGVLTPLPGWSAYALETAPGIVAEIHASYAEAGATLHTANSFRTRSRTFPKSWKALTLEAVRLCRESIPRMHRVAGSIAPLEDCYRPNLSPEDPRPEHREFAMVLADAGCDVLLCETFPNVREGLIAVEEAVATGVETWVSFTAGPNANLLTPEEVRIGGVAAVQSGAKAVLVNCIPASKTERYVKRLSKLGVPYGAYANAGHADEGFGWRAGPSDAKRYAEVAEGWLDEGATILGGCCGTGVAHVQELARRLFD